jgi:predicted SAM-dependent methyltransferase
LIKLHLGCGKKILPGFINIDILPSPGLGVRADLRHLPLASETADRIYSCANIEHFGRKEWISVLREWSRVLKPGGILQISTMDFEACCEEYAQNRNLPQLLGLLIGGQKDKYDWHGMIFDFETLRRGLEEAGFENPRRYDWRKSEVGLLGIDDFSQAYLPHMQKKTGRLMMLNLEAKKAVRQGVSEKGLSKSVR